MRIFDEICVLWFLVMFVLSDTDSCVIGIVVI
jgi:hypothetical protein